MPTTAVYIPVVTTPGRRECYSNDRWYIVALPCRWAALWVFAKDPPVPVAAPGDKETDWIYQVLEDFQTSSFKPGPGETGYDRRRLEGFDLDAMRPTARTENWICLQPAGRASALFDVPDYLFVRAVRVVPHPERRKRWSVGLMDRQDEEAWARVQAAFDADGLVISNEALRLAMPGWKRVVYQLYGLLDLEERPKDKDCLDWVFDHDQPNRPTNVEPDEALETTRRLLALYRQLLKERWADAV